MKAAILDDGVNEGWLKEKNIVNLQIDKEYQIVPRTDYDKYEKNHGSICAAILKKYAPDCEIVSIKVLDENGHGSCRTLLRAMDWCIENNIKLIHMSIGSTNYIDYELLRKKTAQLINNNSIIVAACHNGGKYTIPACLSGVIGVKACDMWSNKEYQYNRWYFYNADVLARSTHYINGEYTLSANSYAAPYITARIYNILREGCLSVAGIKQRLYNDWIKEEIHPREYRVNLAADIDFIYNAYVIDFDSKLQYELSEFELEKANPEELSSIKICGTISVIIVGNARINDKDVMSFLKNNKSVITGTAVCGKISGELMKFLYHQQDYLLWTTEMPHPREKIQNTEIPIISVKCSDRRKQTQAGKIIAKEFAGCGYGTLMISDDVCSPVYGYKYFQMEELTDGFVNWYINKVEPDIVVADFNDNGSIYSDIQIYCNNMESKRYDIYDGKKVIKLNVSEDLISDTISNYLS